MKTSEEIKRLQDQLNRLKEQQSRCKHDYAEAIFDPETYVDPIFESYREGGSDPEPISTLVDRVKDRWSRECKICGHKQYTYTQEPVISSYKPKFN